MIELKTPNGLSVNVPSNVQEDVSPHFNIDQLEEAKLYYKDNGYVVFSSIIENDDCDEMRSLWDREVKSYPGKIYRQATAQLEYNVYNDSGWVMNPILNLQSLNPRDFPKLRKTARSKILTAPKLARVFRSFFEDRPKIVQSMYFEGNSATWEHQDSYYLDSEQLGTMAAAWIAMEDIAPTAGRFFVCPKSHLLDWKRQSSIDNIAYSHDVYVQSVVQTMKNEGFEVRAPALRKGDVLFWNAFTIHGSLDSQDSVFSRSSVTCHAIPEGHQLIQMQSLIRRTDVEVENDVAVYAPKDLAKMRNKLIYNIESKFSRPFYALKRKVLASVVNRNA